MNSEARINKEEWENAIKSLVRTVQTNIQRRTQHMMDKYELSQMHIAYLELLVVGSATLKALSQELGVDRANTTRAINGLRDRGLVEDDRRTENSRKYNVFLTKAGREFASGIKEELDKAFEEYMEGISQDEVHTMIDTLGKIQANAEKTNGGQPYKPSSCRSCR